VQKVSYSLNKFSYKNSSEIVITDFNTLFPVNNKKINIKYFYLLKNILKFFLRILAV